MLNLETIFSARGGVETYVHQISKRLVNNGHNVFVISRSKNSYRQSVFDGVDYIQIPIKDFNLSILRLYSLQMLLFNFEAAIEIKKLNHVHHFDIVHAQFCSGFLYAILRLITYDKTKFVVTLHGTLVDEQLSRKKKSVSSFILIIMEYLTIKLANGVIASSYDTLRSARRHYGLDNITTEVIYSGVDLERFNLKRPNESLKKNQSRMFNVLYVGRVDERKRINILIHAAELLLSKYNTIRFLLVGPGTEQCFSYLTNKTFKPFFICAGTVSEEILTNYYLMSDVFVLPSIYEGFGLVIVEAFAAGKPVIAFNAGSLPELVKNGETGILLGASESANELASSIENLMLNDALRTKMAYDAKETAKNFTWTKSVNKTITFYETILSSA